MSNLKRLVFCLLALTTLMAMFVETVAIRRSVEETATRMRPPLPAPSRPWVA